MCTAQSNGETRLNDLINDGSPTNELELLTRWFALLSSNVKESGFEAAIKSGGFTTANIRSNLLNAFYLIIELKREDQQPLVEQLLTTIRDILDAGTQQFFTEDHKQTLQGLRALAKEQRRHQPLNNPRTKTLYDLGALIASILDRLLPAPSRAIKSGNRPPPK
ncbi:hypothetical protein BLNAU_21092 [Blattamonas nauphoetae]|uniref:Uncharacterized protein n=1 Tax=Blattamonas nauphoetae TaxID=2049346 RepID=A0ABQ9WWW8_9EUKA|nr:hypothetical protein BLNAU_21092 [Blattamonas nauphoetae]